VQDEFADVGGLFDGVDSGGQWLSGHSGLSRLEFDTN